MNQKQVNRIIELLEDRGVSFTHGLSDEEVIRVQNGFDITLPVDLRLLLQTRLPVSDGFVHWRYGINSQKGKAEIEQRLSWPKEGMLFDIKHNAFWLDEWGEKPEKYAGQKRVAENELAKQPKLVPIYSHRYIPSEPNEIGNPVFSVSNRHNSLWV